MSGSTAVEIADGIEQQIRRGELIQNASLPSVRDLATRLNVSPNTVAAAYKALRDSGQIVTDGRRGTRVTGMAAVAEHSFAVPDGLCDLASGNLDSALLPAPNADWLGRHLGQTGFDQYGNDPHLTDLASQWLQSQRLPHEHIGIYSGALDAIERALRARCRPGTSVLIEDPCWPPLRDLLAGLRLKPTALQRDSHGALPPVNATLRSAAAVVLTPRAQNPTGCSFNTARWQQWSAALQGAPDTLLVIDDHWGPLSDAPIADLHPLPANWVYVLSTSKFLGPDLRLSIASACPSVQKDMQRQQRVGPRWVSLLLQRLAAHLWGGMLTEDGLSKVSHEYRRRRQALIEALAPMGVEVEPGGEGLHLWLPVLDETSVVQRLASRGWAVQAGSPFRLASATAVRISVGNLKDDDIAPLATDIVSALQAPRRAVY